MTNHTILLTQPSQNKGTRTFSDHESIPLALEEIIRMYESRLKELNPNVRNITYKLKDLNKYIDHLSDIGALVFDEKLMAYVPHDREWIKQRIYKHLQNSAK